MGSSQPVIQKWSKPVPFWIVSLEEAVKWLEYGVPVDCVMRKWKWISSDTVIRYQILYERGRSWPISWVYQFATSGFEPHKSAPIAQLLQRAERWDPPPRQPLLSRTSKPSYNTYGPQATELRQRAPKTLMNAAPVIFLNWNHWPLEFNWTLVVPWKWK